jgi:uncharacterized membrane protein YccC
MADGQFTIPTRVYLSAVQRAKLKRLLERDERELDELLTALLAALLANEPEPPAPAAVPDTTAEELRRRRAELRRLRPKLNDPHNPPPAWLRELAAELETEIARLEQE